MIPSARRPRLALLTVLLAAGIGGADAADAPVTPGALPEVGWVLQLLREVSGSKIIAGQQERVDWFGLDNEGNIDFVRNTTGLTPAIRGFDFMFYTHSAGGRQGQRAAERAILWARRGGIVQFCIHWFVDTGSSPGNPKFYTSETTFDIRRALQEGTPENLEFIREMDLMAGELRKLRDAGVPVIWRPFHECDGGWFWWGAKGPEPFKQAFRLMFDRYTRVHGLNNLIWCYNPTDASGALEAWYPGDDVVDLIGLDIYPAAGTHPHYAGSFRRFRDFTGGRKPVTLTENGGIPDLDAMFAAGAGWPSFCTWNGFESDPARNDPAFLRKVYQDPRTITLETMPDVYRRNRRPPAITLAPAAAAGRAGEPVALAVTATGSGTLEYQWTRDGVTLAGAADPVLLLPRAAAGDSGSYAVTVRNPFGEAASAAVRLDVSAATPAAAPTALANLSTRAGLATHGDVLVVGFVVRGSGAKPVVIRAAGPALAAFGVPSVHPDPAITVVDDAGRVVAENDSWGEAPPAEGWSRAFAAMGAFPFPAGSRDAALSLGLPPGGYTVLVRSADAVSGGTVLAEIYDAGPGHPSRLVNLSTRGGVTAAQPLIAGFVIQAPGTHGLLVRAAGPALAGFGLGGTLAAPQLRLTTAAGAPLGTNAGWSEPAGTADSLALVAASVGAFPFTRGSRDAALLARQPAAGYTALVAPSGNDRGVALVEVYETP